MSTNLQIETVYLYPLENAKQHKTDRYEIVHDELQPIPVVRRGKRFTIAIRFVDRGYDKKRDGIRLFFNFGSKPNVIKGTQGIIRLGQSKLFSEKESFWWGRIIAEGKDTLTIEAYAPPTAPVGIWHIQIETTILNSSLPPTIYDYDNILYILFNPWNCHDIVYMPDERLLDEYILTDVGKVWVGPYGSSRGREWVFGQFDACVLPAAMLMFDKSGIPLASRGDAIKVSRTISKMVNSNDDDGILVGRWDGEYSDGTAPSEWTGSVPILQQYLDTQSSVSYGQCWVFSGVVTTLCRALGIPSRVVSNLVSAHDANATLTVDKYYNPDGEEIDFDPNNYMGEDSIWNYHVWNDVYMARPDLPSGYGGWQAIDATPQETSTGFYQCGPASLEAIKQGQVGFNYDIPFMVASVNADLMRWKEDHSADMGYSKIYCNKHHIGRMILTKKPFIFDPNGDKDREDITIFYKAKEGSQAERLSLLNAVRGTEMAKMFYSVPDPGLEDVEFNLEDIDKIRIGQNFSVVVTLKNKCSTPRNIKAVLSAGSVFYTGVKAKFIKKAEGEFLLKPKTSETLKLSVSADDYLDKLVEYCNIKISAIASVKETNQTWADEDDFQVLKPNIDIKMPVAVPVGRPVSVTLRFVNPLKKTLTNCRFNLSGPSLLRNQMIPYGDVQPEAVVKMTTDIVPKRLGEQKLVATFTSKELLDITGSMKLEVEEE